MQGNAIAKYSDPVYFIVLHLIPTCTVLTLLVAACMSKNRVTDVIARSGS